MVLEGRLPNSEDGPMRRMRIGNSRDAMCSVSNVKTTSYSGSSGDLPSRKVPESCFSGVLRSRV